MSARRVHQIYLNNTKHGLELFILGLLLSISVLLIIGCDSGQTVMPDDQESLDKYGPKYTADLLGANEVNTGDPDGSGTAVITINAKQGTLIYEIVVSNITLPATASHIHLGAAGVVGGVVVTFAPPDANGLSSGTLTGLDETLLSDIRKNPSNYYVNVHNSEYPAGAVRGQLQR